MSGESKRSMCFMFPFCSKNEKELWDKKRVTTSSPQLRNYKKNNRVNVENKNEQSEMISKINYYRNYFENSKNKLTIG